MARHNRRINTHDKIVSAAAHLFAEKGYLGTSMDEIAKAARMKKPTLYHYFRSKSELLFENSSRQIQSLIDNAIVVLESNRPPHEKLRILVTNHVTHLTSTFGRARLSRPERKCLPAKLLRRYVALRDEYEMILRRVVGEIIAVEHSGFDDARIATRFIFGMINSVNDWYNPKGPLSGEEIASKACDFIMCEFEANGNPSGQGTGKVRQEK